MKRTPAALGLLGFLVLLPVALTVTVGGPFLPRVSLSDVVEILNGSYLPVDTVVRAITILCWALWAYLTIVVVLRLAATILVRRKVRAGNTLMAVSRAVTPRLIKRVVDVTLGMTILASSVSVAHALPRSSVTQPPLVGVVPGPIAESASPSDSAGQYVVKGGDSLWEIAEEQLGSGYRWREIWELNRGRTFPDGRVLHHPRLIHPGWVLELPIPEAHHPAPTPLPRVAAPQEPQASADIPLPATRKTTRELEHSKAPVSTQPPVIELPSGTLLAATFASGVLAAQTLSAIRRRRSRRALSDPDQAEESPLVLDLRRRVRAPAGGHLEAAAMEVAGMWQRVHASLPRFLAAREEPERAVFHIAKPGDDDHVAMPPSSSRIAFVDEGRTVRAEVRRPFLPKMVRAETPLETGLLIPLGWSGRETAYIASRGSHVPHQP